MVCTVLKASLGSGWCPFTALPVRVMTSQEDQQKVDELDWPASAVGSDKITKLSCVFSCQTAGN